MRTRGGFAVSRESFLIFNNVLLMVATGLILIGTLYPLFLETLGLRKISVGLPYFNKVFIVPMLPLLAFLAVGMHAGWKKARPQPLKRPLTIIALVAAAAALVVPALAWGSFHWLTVVKAAAAGLAGFSRPCTIPSIACGIGSASRRRSSACALRTWVSACSRLG